MQEIRFAGDIVLRRDDAQLLIEGRPAQLGGRAFEVLCALAERPGQLVTKRELMDRVWPDVVVEENNLQVQISTLRRLLGPAAIITVALFVVAQIALTRTTWGRRVQLLGANPKAARISGVDVRFVTWSVYAVAGVFSGIAGVELVASLSAANADTGSPFLLPVIGAVIIGGTSLFGGQGSIARTGMGVLFLAVLINGLSLLGFQVFDQQAVEGAVILLAVALDILLRRKGYVDNA